MVIKDTINVAWCNDILGIMNFVWYDMRVVSRSEPTVRGAQIQFKFNYTKSI